MTNIDYKLLALNVYDASVINKTPVPEGWTQLAWQSDDVLGFSAGAYRNGGEVVIAYAGTNETLDWLSGNSAALGLPATQVFDAMRFYLDVKAANPDATSFSFTGHSLGGGLASLMAVFFDKQATVFDEAPFQLTAIDPLILSALEVSLLATGYTDLDFALYNASFATLFPFRENNVNHVYLDGEILVPVRFLYPTIAGTDAPLSMGDSMLNALNRHAMTLLTAMEGNTEFASLVQQLPSFATYLLDSAWFGVTDRRSEGETDLLSTLLIDQYGAENNGKLDHFVADMNQLLGNDGVAQNNVDVRDALMATVMNYYFNKVDVNADNLFTVTGNSLNFKYSDIGNEKPEIRPLLAHEVSALLSSADSSETSSAYSIFTRLMQQNAWHIQTSSGGMTWSSTEIDNDVVIGGSEVDVVNTGEGNDLLYGLGGNDELNGGAGSDELFGNIGNDILNGGEGADTLNGGAGDDVYVVDHIGDKVIENANEGTDTVRSSVTYTLGGGSGADTLVGGAGDDTYIVDNTGDAVIENANEGTDTVRSSITYTLGENVEKLILTGTDALDGTGNALNNTLTGNNAANTLNGGAGQDTLTGGDGKDVLVGGTENDILHGDDGAGGDTLDGGAGNDTYYADDGDTIRDSDGKGTIYLNGKHLTFATRKKGEILYKDAAGNTYLQIGNTLQINDPLVIENFTAGDLGITLDEYSPPSPGSAPLQEAFGKAEQTKSPIVLDLNGNGIATQDLSTGIFFDYDGNGFAERTGWATSGDGILVRDLNSNGQIDNGSELFGDRTKLKNGQTAANGFAALADLDSNGDGKLDSQDSAWTELNIWQDLDSDGSTDAGELKTLSDLGIQSIATGYSTNASTDANGNIHQQQGSYTKTDGSTALAEDVWFKADQSSTRNLNQLALSVAIHNMPEIQGKGNVGSLRQVMAQQDASGSSTLKNLVVQFAAEADPVARNALTTRIIYEWAGVTGKDPLSRTNKMYGNVIGDARKLYAMEALLGEGYVGIWCWNEKDPNPHGPAAAILLKAYDEFANGIAAQLMQQTRLKDVYNAIAYTWDATTQTLHADLSGTLPLITAKLDANLEQGKTELAEFITNLIHTNDVNTLNKAAFQDALAAYGQDVISLANLAWRGMMTTQGNDQLTGDGTDEVIAGLGGNDLIYGGGGNDSLLGEAGNDALYGQAGNDTLDGGAGNDLLDGGVGNDTYWFGRGSGQDTLVSQDSTVNKRDVLKLATEVLPADIDLIRNIDDLILTIRDTGDRMTVAGYFVNDGVSQSSLEAIEFDDGTTWNFATVKAMLPSLGTEGDDRIRGYNTTEIIDGLGGNDVIEGEGGDDTIGGGAGNDMLFGQQGNDILDGGIGNDSVQGGTGNDTYLFGRGSGQDTVIDYDSTAGNLDKVLIASGILPTDVIVTRDSSNLYLNINNPNGTKDKLTLQNWFVYGDAYKVEQVLFADDPSTVWDVVALNTLANTATENADYIEGAGADDSINGLGGNDTIVGGAGNDTLDGGAGNDSLQGGTGNDTYLFGRGYGQDVAYDYNTTEGSLDKVQIISGVLPADVKVTRDSSSLYLSISHPNGTTDKLTLQNWYSQNVYKIEQVVFARDVNGLGKNDQWSNGQSGNYTLTSGIMNSEIWKKAS